MANIKSAKKRAVQSEKHRDRNRSARTALRTVVKKARAAKSTGDADAPKAVLAASSALDSAAHKGLIHPNKAARLKSRMTKKSAATT